jgi:hypothetical protein
MFELRHLLLCRSSKHVELFFKFTRVLKKSDTPLDSAVEVSGQGTGRYVVIVKWV